MPNIQCKMCGAPVELREGVFSDSCKYCGALITLPKIDTEEQERLYNRAEHFRRLGEFDKAIRAYAQIVAAAPDDPEVHWGMVLSRYGIEYVEDPASHQRIPTCHRVSTEPVPADADYLAAVENAGDRERGIYEKEAERIEQIRKGILAISAQEQPFDVFICYKESDESGKRTRDSVAAQEIYYALTEAGYKVFFARITLESKLGHQYEPYIFAALNSARVMLVVGSSQAHFNATWVRNEWGRYLELMKTDRRKLLIPCFRDMDAYDLPEELSMFQSQDMGKIGFIQDLLRGIQKVVGDSRDAAPARVETPPAAASSGAENPLLVRARLFVETGDFESAKKYCERVLDAEPRNGDAYFCRLMAERKVSDEGNLTYIPGILDDKTFKLAEKFACSHLAARIAVVRKAVEAARLKAVEAARRKTEALSMFEISGGTLCRVKHGIPSEKLRDITIPDDITAIGESAFEYYSNLRSVIIPASVTKIGESAFFGCTSLQSVTIPASVTKIGDCAFAGCSSLQSVIIPDSVNKIGGCAFEDCSNLQDAQIGMATKIAMNAFSDTPCEDQVKKAHRGQFLPSSDQVVLICLFVVTVMLAIILFAVYR